MLDLRNIPTSREKISLVGNLLSEAKNQYNEGRVNFDNREKKIWEASNETYNANNAASYSDTCRTLSTKSLIYNRLQDSLDSAYFPDAVTRERVMSALNLNQQENSAMLSYVSNMIEIGSQVETTKFNPDNFCRLQDVVPDDYMRLAERVSDCKDIKEAREQKIESDKHQLDSTGREMSEYITTFQESIEKSITDTYGENPTANFNYATKLTPEFVQEIITNGQALSSNIQEVPEA